MINVVGKHADIWEFVCDCIVNDWLLVILHVLLLLHDRFGKEDGIGDDIFTNNRMSYFFPFYKIYLYT